MRISYDKTACVHTGNTFSINVIMHSYIVLIPYYNHVGISYYMTACVHTGNTVSINVTILIPCYNQWVFVTIRLHVCTQATHSLLM